MAPLVSVPLQMSSAGLKPHLPCLPHLHVHPGAVLVPQDDLERCGLTFPQPPSHGTKLGLVKPPKTHTGVTLQVHLPCTAPPGDREGGAAPGSLLAALASHTARGARGRG